MSVAKKIFYIKNSQYLEIDGLKDQSVTPVVYMNAAIITATLIDTTGRTDPTSGNVIAPGATIAGFVAVTGVYIASSNGSYRFQVDPTVFNPPLGSGYTIQVNGSQSGKLFYGELPAQVATRKTGLESSS